MQVASAVSTLKANPSDSVKETEELPNSLKPMNPMDYSSTHEDDDDDVSDLGEVVDANSRSTSSHGEISDVPDTDDSDMAKQIEAAGEGESLIGSDDSSDESQLAKEEQYMIRDAARHRQDVNLFDDNNVWDSLTPAGLSLERQDVIADELFKPQRGFASSPEPSFSDFFDSSDEMDAQHGTLNDDEILTTDESSGDYDDTSSTVSEVGSLSVPLIAHMGPSHEPDGNKHDFKPEDVPSDEAALKTAIPLLVIEDLDGRLIYARAGDGEAVFGSDGEFEFAGESDEESSENDTFHGTTNSAHPSHVYPPKEEGVFNADNSLMDDGDTTDELPDEDMPYPRLLIGSIAPKGGRNARRAREIAARTRCSSRLSSPAPSTSNAPTAMTPKKPSSLSNVITIDDDDNGHENPSDRASVEHKDSQSAATHVRETKEPTTPKDNDLEESKPMMGQFMPAFSKSVHRAVIDGSHRAPSPFNALHNMQRDLRRKRSQTAVESSFDRTINQSSQKTKRKRTYPLSMKAQDADLVNAGKQSETLGSSPEPPDSTNGEMMDLSDVLDEGLLWQDSTSDSSEEDASVNKNAVPWRKRLSSSGPHDRAFARWNRIPMGAFRTAQEKGISNDVSPVSDAYMTHQRPSSTFLLTQSFSGRRKSDPSRPLSLSTVPKKQQTTPFKRTIAAMNDFQDPTSPLHLTLADPAISSGSTKPNINCDGPSSSSRKSVRVGEHAVVGGNFLVSPVLRPVKHRGHNTINPSGDESTSPLAGLDSMVPSDASPSLESRGRKVTKREKRERLARREAVKRQQSGSLPSLPSHENY